MHHPAGGWTKFAIALKQVRPASTVRLFRALVRYIIRHLEHISADSGVAAIDIGAFTNVEEYKEHVDNLIEGLKALPKAEGFDEILVPGEPEDRVYEDRIRHGIPLPQGTVRRLRDVAERLDIRLPPGM